MKSGLNLRLECGEQSAELAYDCPLQTIEQCGFARGHFSFMTMFMTLSWHFFLIVVPERMGFLYSQAYDMSEAPGSIEVSEYIVEL